MNELREMRERAGLSQSEVAKEMQVHQSAVSLWESGRQNPSWKRCEKLAELYGCNASDIAAAILKNVN